ncbi:hypothetical protein [Streptomyces sp. 7N604]|uniref:hypothetical protein n=1 Tax=Streptomyces sp. 7N604 TaxID=3457415 RepID=UPI003FD26753
MFTDVGAAFLGAFLGLSAAALVVLRVVKRAAQAAVPAAVPSPFDRREEYERHGEVYAELLTATDNVIRYFSTPGCEETRTDVDNAFRRAADIASLYAPTVLYRQIEALRAAVTKAFDAQSPEANEHATRAVAAVRSAYLTAARAALGNDAP